MPRDVKADILDAAITQFCSVGYDGASIGEIAKVAGVSKASILYHFASKEDLWKDAVDALYARLQAFYAARLSEAVPATREGFEYVLRTYYDACIHVPEHVNLLNLEGHSDTWRSQWIARRHLARHFKWTGAFNARLIAAGLLPNVELDFLQNMLAGGGQLALGQHPLWQAAMQTRETPEEVADRYVRRLMDIVFPRLETAPKVDG